jgi:hypothetical protein
MPPRNYQNQNMPSTPGDALPPSRRADSVDGVAPRSVQRPAAIRTQSERPVFARSNLGRQEPWRPPAAASQALVVPPLDPAAVAAPTLVADAGDNDDAVQLALAGPTPIASTLAQPSPEVSLATSLKFEAPARPAKPVEEPIVKKRRIKLPHVAWRKLLQRKVLIPSAALSVLVLAGYGANALIAYNRTQASPDTIYKDALSNALVTKQVQISKTSDTEHAISLVDVTNLKSPRVSSDITTNIAGAQFKLKTYGTIKNSFFSYTNLPDGLTGNTAKAVENQWVILRRDGQLPAAVNTALSNAADPRYQAFGPLLFANLPPKTSHTIANFLADHHVYGYKLASVKSVRLGDKKVLLFSGKFDADYAKIANQSIATSEGFSINDIQRVVDSLTVYKDGTSSLYVDAATRQPVQLVLKTKTGQTTTYSYSNQGHVSLPSQPSSNIDWPAFASTQLQVEAQTSAIQTATIRDSIRQANLSTIQASLTQYYAKNGFFPSLANMNNQTWIATNLPSFDPDTTRDPEASTLALLENAPTAPAAPNPKSKVSVVATPIVGYIYQPTTAAGKACANEATTTPDQQCANYTVAATLSTGKTFVLKNTP